MDFVASLLEFPPEKQLSTKEYDKKATDFVKSLRKQNSSVWVRPAKQQNILELLNPTRNTLPYLFALVSQTAQLGKDRAHTEEMLNQVVVFFASFDPIQVRYAGDLFHELLVWAFEIYPKLAITDFTPLTTAMLRLDPTAGTFTSSHLRLVRLCLMASAPRQALPVLDKNIVAFPQTPLKTIPDDYACDDHESSSAYITATSGFTLAPIKSEWVLEYYLLGAHAYIGLRNFSRARLFLEHVLLTPTLGGSCSALQTEAYKKWVLLGLLAQGKRYPQPRTHSTQVFKSLQAVGKAYDELAQIFETRQWRRFHAEVEAGTQVWQDDGNVRLVKEANDALMRYRVLDLQKTYAALPVSRVAELLKMSVDATHYLLGDMLQQGYLAAQITPQTSTAEALLRFSVIETPTQTAADDSLEAQTSRIQSLISSLRDTDRRLQLTKEYVEVQRRNKRGGLGMEGDPADQMDLTYDAPIPGFDEDEEDLGVPRNDDDMMETR